MKKWKPNSWRNYPVKHIPDYKDEKDPNNMIFGQIQMGYYYEMKQEKNADKTIDFDFDSLKIKNKDNPVFYVQYAYARCMSILEISKNKIKEIEKGEYKLDYLILHEEKMLIKYICNFYNIIKNSAEYFEPHRITNYLYDLSKTFHNYWGLGNIDNKNKIITDNNDLTKSRLILVKVVSMTLNKGLSLLKISSPKSM